MSLKFSHAISFSAREAEPASSCNHDFTAGRSASSHLLALSCPHQVIYGLRLLSVPESLAGVSDLALMLRAAVLKNDPNGALNVTSTRVQAL